MANNVYTNIITIVCISAIVSLPAVTVLDGPVGARDLEASTSLKGIIINIWMTKSSYTSTDIQYGPC